MLQISTNVRAYNFLRQQPAAPDYRSRGNERDGEALSAATGLPRLLPYQFMIMMVLAGKDGALAAFVRALRELSLAPAEIDDVDFARDGEPARSAQIDLGLTDVEMDSLWSRAASIWRVKIRG